MKQQFKLLLSSCVEYIELCQNGLGEKKDLCKKDIINQYNSINNDEKNELYDLLYQSFEHDTRLYTLIMSALYLTTNEVVCLKEIIRYITDNKIELFDSMIVKSQLLMALFSNSKVKIAYQESRLMHKNLLYRFEQLLDVECNYRPVVERNKNKIVIITEQLLADLHAPTRIIKEICASLQKDLGIEVLLIVAIGETNRLLLWENWTSPLVKNYIEEYDGNFLIEHNNEKIQGFQLVINNETVDIQKRLIMEVCHMKPLFVWSMGDNFLFADQFRRYTTVVTQRFSTGVPVAEGSILLDYFDFQLDNDTLTFLEEKNQKHIRMSLTLPVKETNKILKRQNFNIPEKAFVISIIGNRLDNEVSSEFWNMLKNILYNDKSGEIYFVFIGEFKSYDSLVLDSVLENKSTYIGYQDDLLAVVKLMDLFLNPPRLGGGNGGLLSLYQGVPVITLENCDVAFCAGENFICKDLSEMMELVFRYLEDKNYYEQQSKIAYQVSRNYADLSIELKKVINKVVELS